jgi:tetrahydromethanopterin S-methyltransferase subunit G
MVDSVAARIARLETRLDEISDQASASRALVAEQLKQLAIAVAVGEKSHAEIAKKLDSLAAKVDSLLTQQHESHGAAKSWAPVFDVLYKIAVGVGIAYVIFFLKIK